MRAEKGFVKINEVNLGLSKVVINTLRCAPVEVTHCEGRCRWSLLLFHLPTRYLVLSFCPCLWSALFEIKLSFVLRFTWKTLTPPQNGLCWIQTGPTEIRSMPAIHIRGSKERLTIIWRVSNFNTVYTFVNTVMHLFVRGSSFFGKVGRSDVSCTRVHGRGSHANRSLLLAGT